MATVNSSNIQPLNGSNYPTWKVQTKMTLLKDNLWGIVSGTETAPPSTDNTHANFIRRRDKALATIVLAVDATLLYLLGEMEDPKQVWDTLQGQFQKRTWANKLRLRKQLYALKLHEGGSVQEHMKLLTETFNELSIVGDTITDEDRVVHLLASLPDSYNVLVTALEAGAEVPSMEMVTERLLHEERKISGYVETEKAMNATKREIRRGPRCYECGEIGHLKRDCPERKTKKSNGQRKSWKKRSSQKAHTAQGNGINSSDSDCGLTVQHGLTAACVRDDWIIDSGATSHMCNNREKFTDFVQLKRSQDVTLGDGHRLMAEGRGRVVLELEGQRCKLDDVLYVPDLSFNLVSVSKAMCKVDETVFTNNGCKFLKNGREVATGKKVGELYYLDCRKTKSQEEFAAPTVSSGDLWHRRFGHLGIQSMKRLIREDMVAGMQCDMARDIGVCEACAEGKLHRLKFPTGGGNRAKAALDLVHSDVCGKVSTKSLSGSEYFLTFIDDKTRYTWVYILKSKADVFRRFLEWKALVENSMGRKLKTLRTDNGGEFTSAEFERHLQENGIRHQTTTPKTPEQNGVAERMNRTVVEMARSMLSDAKLPRRFWAEAVTTAVYLRNRSPTSAVDGMTPFEALTGAKPNVDMLRVFGCLAYVHVAKDERRKFDSKARRCIFLGYGTERKAYRLYDAERQKIISSRDVIFDESKCGIEEERIPTCTGHMNSDNDDKSTTEDEVPEIKVEIPEIKDEEPVSEDEESVIEDEPKRPVRLRKPPDMYGDWATLTRGATEPTSVHEVMKSPDKEKWKSAMENEMKSLHSNDVWDLVPLPAGRKVVGSKWVFKVKVAADGAVDRHKARLVAQGFSQKYGLDYDETFCPVVRSESVRAVIALAAGRKLKLHQLDVTTAFLNGTLDEEVFMKQPEGFVVNGKENLVCKLKKSIYGLKQSPRCWNVALDSHLKSIGLQQSASDPCLYTAPEGEMAIVAVYVDDILIATESEKKMRELKKCLSKKFDVKDLGELTSFLGVQVNHDPRGIWIGQPGYTTRVLEKFGMAEAKPVSTPVDTSVKLASKSESPEFAASTYQSAVGCLLYLSNWTRPDLTFAVSKVARYSADPRQEHWTAVKRILRYLKGTINYGITYSKDSRDDLVGYCDADWAGDVCDRKSTSGYVFCVSGSPVSWRSKKQSCVALSTAEAEYVALSAAAQEAVWLRNLMEDLSRECQSVTTIHDDSQAAISMSKNPQFHGKSKHIEIKYHYIREQVLKGSVSLKYCPTEEMLADILTKGLNREQHVKLTKGINIMSS